MGPKCYFKGTLSCTATVCRCSDQYTGPACDVSVGPPPPPPPRPPPPPYVVRSQQQPGACCSAVRPGILERAAGSCLRQRQGCYQQHRLAALACLLGLASHQSPARPSSLPADTRARHRRRLLPLRRHCPGGGTGRRAHVPAGGWRHGTGAGCAQRTLCLPACLPVWPPGELNQGALHQFRSGAPSNAGSCGPSGRWQQHSCCSRPATHRPPAADAPPLPAAVHQRQRRGLRAPTPAGPARRAAAQRQQRLAVQLCMGCPPWHAGACGSRPSQLG